MGLFDGIQNFNPAFEAEQMAIQQGHYLAQAMMGGISMGQGMKDKSKGIGAMNKDLLGATSAPSGGGQSWSPGSSPFIPGKTSAMPQAPIIGDADGTTLFGGLPRVGEGF